MLTEILVHVPLLMLKQLTKLFDVACSLTDVLALHPASRDPFSPGPREHLNPLLNILSVLRNGDYRFVPLLLNKVNEVLPKLANPMLQNVPDSVAANACNIDIFDGFGNAGMAQPPVMMDEYEKKYNPHIEDLPTDSGSSQVGSSSSNNGLNSPFIGSPPVMSPGGEYAHGLPDSYNPMSGILMNQMGGSASHNGQHQPSNPPQTPHSQHQQHPSIPAMQNIGAHIQTGLNPPMDQPPNNNMEHQSRNFAQPFNNGIAYMNAMSQNVSTNNMMNRQGPTRANSFAVAPNSQLRTIREFDALQRANSDMSTMNSLGMNGLSSEMDFNSTLR